MSVSVSVSIVIVESGEAWTERLPEQQVLLCCRTAKSDSKQSDLNYSSGNTRSCVSSEYKEFSLFLDLVVDASQAFPE